MRDGPWQERISRRALIRYASLASAVSLLGAPASADPSAMSDAVATEAMVAPSVTAATVSELSLRKQSVLFELASGSFLPFSALPHVLGKNLNGDLCGRCVVLGEVHDEIQTHAAQLATLEYALRLPDKRPLVVAFEQFYRMHNPILERYIAGEISLDTMLTRTAWASTWGFDAALYVYGLTSLISMPHLLGHCLIKNGSFPCTYWITECTIFLASSRHLSCLHIFLSAQSFDFAARTKYA
jgi:hypothetical protein